MDFILSFFKGIALGTGAILPGISSGVLCVIFGIYEKLIDSILGFFKDIKNNFKFLFPILIGVTFGVIIFGNILKYLFTAFPFQTNFAFIGLILGCIPSLLKSVNEKSHFRLHYLLYTLITFSLTLVLLLIENQFVPTNISSTISPIYLIFSGFIMSIGIVVPGVSSTVLLMILGTYNLYLEAVSNVNLLILIPMGIGLIIGALIFLRLIKYCLEHFFAQTYYSILGFVLSSVLILYPRYTSKFNRYIMYNMFFALL